MKIKIILLTAFYSQIIISCKTQNLTETNPSTISKVQQNFEVSEFVQLNFNENSPLLAEVNKNTKDSVTKRIEMDMNPDIEHYQNTAQSIQQDLPAIDISSLKFMPVISRPLIIASVNKDDMLSINNKMAFISGKTKNGENIYIVMKYKIQQVDTTTRNFKILEESYGKKRNEDFLKKLKNRNGIDHWNIEIILKTGDILYQLFDFARTESDNGKPFILTKGDHQLNICYFKNGKPMTCNKSTKFDEIRVTEFYKLLQ
ncbi:hypothetical protein [Sphingobacterium thalpophilum]|uniref:hypothetical protein n=1 Tax=Sphingobacterium thalpophilum TaxID=259 RepID=UPI003C75C112